MTDSLTHLIKISDIAVVNRQRKAMDPKALAELAEDIKSNGLYHNIVVRRPTPEEKDVVTTPWVLSVGGRRLAAHVLLGRTEIEAKLKEELTDPLQIEEVELNENLYRSNLTDFEVAEARARMAEIINLRAGGSRQETTTDGRRVLVPAKALDVVAKEMGVSVATLSKDIKLAKAVKADPSLKTVGSKGRALRIADHRATVSERLTAASTSGILGTLKQKIICADASQLVRTVPTASIDLVFVDLPYGIDVFDKIESSKNTFDDSPETAKDFIADIIPQALRVLKPTGWGVFMMCYEWHQWLQELIHDTCRTHHSYRWEGDSPNACNLAATDEAASELSCDFFRPELPPWIWVRDETGNHGHWPELHASNRYEVLVVVNGGKAKLMKKPVENVLRYPPVPAANRLHPNQKPHDFCREVIERCTVIGERVLDFCCGSGAIPAAAADLGRDFIACDNNQSSVDTALSHVAKFFRPAAHSAIQQGRGNPTSTDADLAKALELIKP